MGTRPLKLDNLRVSLIADFSRDTAWELEDGIQGVTLA
jgi:hypothetical protein